MNLKKFNTGEINMTWREEIRKDSAIKSHLEALLKILNSDEKDRSKVNQAIGYVEGMLKRMRL
tara:strand:- start:184 stop:372 length:189 start_codon:yes stop_codon:yes gene_type:complete